MSATALLARILPLAIGCTLLLAACDHDGSEGPLTVLIPTNAKIAVYGGDDQVAPAGTTLPVPLAVRVTTATGRPIEGVKIRWAVSASSGSVAGRDGSLTDSRGIATASRSLSGNAGRFATTATIEATGALVSFTTVSQVQGAVRMSLLPGDALIRPADTVLAALPAPLRVLIQDHEEQPVPGVTVKWSATGGSVSSETSVTDAQGIAAMSFTRGSIVGPNMVRAAVPGLAGSPTSFTTTTLAGRPAALEKLTGDEQVGTVLTSLASPFVVHVADAWGNSVAGVSVSWMFEAATGPAVLAQTMTAANLPGQSLPVAFYRHQLGEAEGTHVITAAVANRPDLPPVSFTFMAFPTPPVDIGVHDWDDSWYGYCWYGGCGFVLSLVTVQTGTTVAWTWHGSQQHNVVFEDHPTAPVSSGLKTTGAHARTFEAPGTYRYRCTVHSTSFANGMVGTVVVSGPPSDAKLLEKVSGDGQAGTAYGALANPFLVKVVDAGNHSVSGVTIFWTAETDSGPVMVGHSITAYDPVQLHAVARHLHVLGGAVGQQVVTATVEGRPDIAPVSFTATAAPLPDPLVGVYDWDDDYWECYYFGCGFIPWYVRVRPGGTVTWTWHGSDDHDIVFEDDPTTPVSSALKRSGSHTRTFAVPGTYRYRCTVHSTSFTEGMVGMVVVVE